MNKENLSLIFTRSPQFNATLSSWNMGLIISDTSSIIFFLFIYAEYLASIRFHTICYRQFVFLYINIRKWSLVYVERYMCANVISVFVKLTMHGNSMRHGKQSN